MRNKIFLGSILFVTIFFLFEAEGKYNRRGWVVADEGTYKKYLAYCIKFVDGRFNQSPDKVYYQKDDEPEKNCSYFRFDFEVIKDHELLGGVVTSYLTVTDGQHLPTTEESALGQEDECYGGKNWEISVDDPADVDKLMQQLPLKPMIIYDGYDPIPSGISVLSEGCLRYIRLEFKPKLDGTGYPTLYSYAIITNPLVSAGIAPELRRIVEDFKILKHDRVAVNVEANQEEGEFIKRYQWSTSYLKGDAKTRSSPPKPVQRSNSTGSYLPKEDVSKAPPVRQLSAPSIQVPSPAEVQFDDKNWEEKRLLDAKQLSLDLKSEKIINFNPASYKLNAIHIQTATNGQKVDCIRFKFVSTPPGKMDQYSYVVRRNGVINESTTELTNLVSKSLMVTWQEDTGKPEITKQANLFEPGKYSLKSTSTFTNNAKFLYRKYEFETKNASTGCQRVITYAKFQPDGKFVFATADYRKLEITN